MAIGYCDAIGRTLTKERVIELCNLIFSDEEKQFVLLRCCERKSMNQIADTIPINRQKDLIQIVNTKLLLWLDRNREDFFSPKEKTELDKTFKKHKLESPDV